MTDPQNDVPAALGRGPGHTWLTWFSTPPMTSYSTSFVRAVSFASLLALVLLAGIWFATKETAPSIHVRWRAGLSAEDRQALERRFALVQPQFLERETWAYDLLDTSRQNVESLVRHPDVDDTHEIDREAFRVRPEAPRGQTSSWLVHRLGPRVLSDLLPAIVGALIVAYVVATWTSFRQWRAARVRPQAATGVAGSDELPRDDQPRGPDMVSR